MEQTQIPDLNTPPEGAVPASEDALSRARMNAISAQMPHMQATADPGDADLMVEFYRHLVKDDDFIRVKIPGDRLFEVNTQASDYYKQRFSAQWAAYQNQKSQYEGQTLLTDCVWIDDGMRKHLESFGVKTVEGLSGVSDGNLDQLGPGSRSLRDKAKVFVEEQKKLELFDTQAAENDKLKKQLADMAARMEAVEAAQQTALPERGAKK